MPGLHRTPAAAAAVLGRLYDLVPYRNADEFRRWREREARRAAARRRPRVFYHVPLAPRGYTLSTDWSDGRYRFCAATEAGGALLVGVGTQWSACVADPFNSRLHGAEFVTAEEAAAAITGAGHQVTLWDRAAEERREHRTRSPSSTNTATPCGWWTGSGTTGWPTWPPPSASPEPATWAQPAGCYDDRQPSRPTDRTVASDPLLPLDLEHGAGWALGLT